MKSKNFQIAAALILGGFCLYLFFRSIDDWSLVWAHMSKVHIGYFLLAVAVQILSMLIRAVRWQTFLGEPLFPLGKLFLITNIGFMANGVLPARMGELIRPFLVWRSSTHAFSTALATIVMERVFDLLGLLLILAFVFWVYPFPAVPPAGVDLSQPVAAIGGATAPQIANPLDWIQEIAKMGVFVFIALIGAIGVMSYAPEWSLRTAEKLFRPLPHKISRPMLKAVESFEKGASTLRRPLAILYCVILTLLLWLAITFGELAIFWSLDISAIGMTGALFIMAGLCFAVMFPQMPGYVGMYHFALLVILNRTFFIDKNTAGAAAWVMWLSQVPPTILFGFICLVIMGVSFKEISHIQDRLPANEEK